MNEVDYKELKTGGMMRQREAGLFSVRLRVVGGRLTTAQLAAVREAADRFGRGEVHLTTRQGMEIPNVPADSLGTLKAFLARSGVGVGACGPTVRTVTACQGCRVCPSGAIDSAEFARRVDAEFYGAKVPHKFKVGISGCANNCMKAEENDIGIKGWVGPRWTKDPCTFCGVCAAVCPTKAIRVSETDAVVSIALDGCIGCGDCIAACPSGAIPEEISGFRLFAGGKFGRLPSLGQPILGVLQKADEAIGAVRAAIDFFRVHGRPKERFGDTLKRTGIESLERHIRDKAALSA